MATLLLYHVVKKIMCIQIESSTLTNLPVQLVIIILFLTTRVTINTVLSVF